MFMVSQQEAAAIQKAFREGGEWTAVAELRRFFRIEDNACALDAVRAIARWSLTPTKPPADPSPAPP